MHIFANPVTYGQIWQLVAIADFCEPFGHFLEYEECHI